MANPPPAPPAHLLIHAHEGVLARPGRFAWIPARLRALAPAHRRGASAARTKVRVEDLLGREYFAAEDARSLIDLPLPPGTYHVTLGLGELLRRYTVTLEHGARFDL
ncbi:MAG TPA: hypothetical protein VFL86_11865, partial [Burkholderiaceae bacterium]|nr:hypothetical protein [Burkholderiaceae bacterium]